MSSFRYKKPLLSPLNKSNWCTAGASGNNFKTEQTTVTKKTLVTQTISRIWLSFRIYSLFTSSGTYTPPVTTCQKSFSTADRPNSLFLTSFYSGKKKITCFCICRKGVKPEWEDIANDGGKILSTQWEPSISNLPSFLEQFAPVLIKLILATIGSSFDHAELVAI